MAVWLQCNEGVQSVVCCLVYMHVLLTTEDKALKDEATLGSLGVKEGTVLYFKDLGPQISWRTVRLPTHSSQSQSHLLLTVTHSPHSLTHLTVTHSHAHSSQSHSLLTVTLTSPHSHTHSHTHLSSQSHSLLTVTLTSPHSHTHLSSQSHSPLLSPCSVSNNSISFFLPSLLLMCVSVRVYVCVHRCS